MSDKQAGFSALPILIILVLGIAVIWETNEYAKEYSKNVSEVRFDLEKSTCKTGIPSDCDDTDEGASRGPTIVCLTGDSTDCNDSNDEFVFEE